MKIFDKIFFAFVLALFSVFSFFSCKQEEVVYKDEIIYLDGTTPVSDDAKAILKKEYPLEVTVINNGNAELADSGTVVAYHFKEKPEGAGFVDVKDVFATMCGEGIFSEYNWVFDPLKNTLTVYYTDLQKASQKAVINWEKNTITLSAPATYALLTDDKRDEVQRWPSYYAGGKETVFDLGKYGFDILYLSKEDACLIPFSIAQTLFFSDVNMYYYFIDGTFIFDQQKAMEKIYNSGEKFVSVSEKTLPRYVKEESWNTLMFEMDYFCGRKEIMLGSRNSSFLDENLTSYKEKYLSDDKIENAEAIFSFIYGYIDEGHSSIRHPCPYLPLSDYNRIYSNMNDFCGERMKTLLAERGKFIEKKKGKYDFGVEGSHAPSVYYSTSEETAFINFNDFQNAGIKGKDIQGTIEFYRDCMKEIESKGTVKNIVLDLTTNGGGSVSNMQYLAGMITGGKSGCTFKNTQDDTKATYEWKSDTNGDGVFDENDGYFDSEGNPKYKWHLLTSGFSFSCGNLLPTIAKHTGIATVIGQKSGGGICSIRETVLPDGTKLRLSSPWIMQANRVNENGVREYFYSDSGVEPDIPLTDDEFYCEGWADYLESVIPSGTK